MNEIKCVKMLPPCWTSNGEWYDIERGCYVPAPVEPVYVRIHGRKREAIRAKWLWKIVAWYQQRSIASHFIVAGIGLLFVALVLMLSI